MSKAIEAIGLHKRYQQGDQSIVVLNDLHLAVERGEKVAILGRSGSGKSTLLHILAGLDTPDQGSVVLDGVDIANASNDVRARVRSKALGFVYQNHHLLPEFNALENVAMPLRIAGLNSTQAKAKARVLLDEVGLSARENHLPAMLSGGERQRVAVVRAIAGDPLVVLADEPTGNLDVENARDLMNMLVGLASRQDTGVIVVTHDTTMLALFDRVLSLEGGALVAAR